MNMERVYQRLPEWLQATALNLEAFRRKRRRYGPLFRQELRAAQERTTWSRAQVDEYRSNCLSAHLKAAAQVPFWQKRFRTHGVNPNHPDPWMQLRSLPILSKDEVRANVKDIINPTIPPRLLISRHTSGTTGSGLVFPEHRLTEAKTWATWWRYRITHGIQLDTWCGYFGGRSVVTPSRATPPYWRKSSPSHQIMFSAYHLGPRSIRDYLFALREFALPWYHGYPSFLATLASLSRNVTDLEIHRPQIVTTGAENLSALQRTLLREAFASPIREHYGQAESVANISECPYGMLHVDEDFSCVEFEPHPHLADTVRILGSNWSNPAFPLLRYDVGDLATLVPQQCRCGSLSRSVASIDGRSEDVVELPNGALVGRLDHIFKDATQVAAAQVRQSADGKITILVVRLPGYRSNDEALLLAEATNRLGSDVLLSIEYVSDIPREASGKLRFVRREM